MKNHVMRFLFVVALLILAAWGLMAFAPFQGTVPPAPDGAPLIPVEFQSFLLAVVASAIVWLINVYVQAKDRKDHPYKIEPATLGRGRSTVVLFGLAIGLAFLFQPYTLPALPVIDSSDPGATATSILTWAGLVIVASKGLIGYAVATYNILLGKVLDGLAGKVPDPVTDLLKKLIPG